MRKLFKQDFITCLLLIFSSMFIGCNPEDFLSRIPTPPPTYRCYWHDHIAACLVGAELDLPHPGCEPQFLGNNDVNIFPVHSIFEIIESGLYNSNNSSWELTWDVSVYAKTCESDVFSQSSQQMVITQSDIGSRFCYCDIIEESPLIDTLQNISVNDMKHQLTFKIIGVHNQYDGSTGNITWRKTWVGQDSSLYIPSSNRWEFYFPNTAMIGTYHPTSKERVRYIYVHNQYGYY